MSICVIGAVNVDWVARVSELPRPGETVMASSLSRHVGGKGANQAVAAARAGSRTSLIGCAGNDDSGDWLLAYLAAAMVGTGHMTRDAGAPTGQAFITLSDSAENSIVVVAGANDRLAAVDRPAEILSKARVLLGQLETSMEPVTALFAAEAPGCMKVLNAAPARRGAESLFCHCDVLILNETELAHFAGPSSHPGPGTALAAAARSLMTPRCRSVVVTLGSSGVMLVGRDGVQFIEGRRVPVVDTVGAGDCFCGVLAAGLDQGLPLVAAAERANVAASIAVGRRGAAEAMPTREEIDNENRLA